MVGLMFGVLRRSGGVLRSAAWTAGIFTTYSGGTMGIDFIFGSDIIVIIDSR